MKLSWNWISEFVDMGSLSQPEELADLLTSRGLEIENIEKLGKGLENVFSALLLETRPHPNADRLTLCKVITSSEAIEIVCGAKNMKSDDKVALAVPGAQLSNGMRIEKSKIRGVVSHGMLCSESELGLKEISDGIIILPQDTPIGVPIAKVLGRQDTLLTLKIPANRGDCLSHLGIAREIASALKGEIKKPKVDLLLLGGSPIQIQLQAGDGCTQFFGCTIENVQIRPSPLWVTQRLELLGIRSINNVVDASNWVMLELGHPLHAYDADKIQSHRIGVRLANSGESLTLLDGKTLALSDKELVIFDGNSGGTANGGGTRAIGLAGVMGGANSEVCESTRNLFLECAEFDPILVRKAAFQSQRQSEASSRFEKGIDPAGLHYAISRFASLVTNWGGGKIIGTSFASTPAHERDRKARNSPINVDPNYFHQFLGLQLEESKIEEIFRHLNLKIESVLPPIQGPEKNPQKLWRITVPSFRHDLRLKEDLAEELARSVGYDAIPQTIPKLSSSPLTAEESCRLFGIKYSSFNFEMMKKAKKALSETGLCETVNFSFTSQSWLGALKMPGEVRLRNPLSEEHEVLVPSLLPMLIKNSLENRRHHFGSEPLSIRLFELRPTFFSGSSIPSQKESKELMTEMRTGIIEKWKIGLVISGPRIFEDLKTQRKDFDFYDLKALLECLFQRLNVKKFQFSNLPSAYNDPTQDLFHPGISTVIQSSNKVVGYAGMIHPALQSKLKLKEPLWAAELDWEMLLDLSDGLNESIKFRVPPAFPGIERDFALVVRQDLSVEKLTQLAMKVGQPLAKVVKVFDIYRGEQVPKGMTSVAIRVIFYNEERSLAENEADGLSEKIVESWKLEFGAELRN